MLASHNITPNSTWLRSDNVEMYVVLPQNEEIKHDCLSNLDNSTDLAPQWIRVIKIILDGQSTSSIDVLFIPWLCAKIDHGIFKKIG
jgi:hypothetical protein